MSATKPQIEFCKGYKYQLRKDFIIQTKIKPSKAIINDLVCLYTDGMMFIRKYFAWDGCSGPTWDDQYNSVPGIVHDAFSYLMRQGLLNPEIYYEDVNKEFIRMLVLYRDTWLGKLRSKIYRLGLNLSKGEWARKPRKIYKYPKDGI